MWIHMYHVIAQTYMWKLNNYFHCHPKKMWESKETDLCFHIEFSHCASTSSFHIVVPFFLNGIFVTNYIQIFCSRWMMSIQFSIFFISIDSKCHTVNVVYSLNVSINAHEIAWIIPLEYLERRNHMRVIRKHLRDVMNPFDIPDHLFFVVSSC